MQLDLLPEELRPGDLISFESYQLLVLEQPCKLQLDPGEFTFVTTSCLVIFYDGGVKCPTLVDRS